MQITLDAKSWHSNYYRWVFGSNLPKSLCPYFWQMVIITVALPFILLVKGVIWLVNIIPVAEPKPEKKYTPEELKKKWRKDKRIGLICEIAGKIVVGIMFTAFAILAGFVLFQAIKGVGLLAVIIILLAIIGGITVFGLGLYLLIEEGYGDKIINSMVIQVPIQLVSGMYYKMCPLIVWKNVPVDPEAFENYKEVDQYGQYID